MIARLFSAYRFWYIGKRAHSCATSAFTFVFNRAVAVFAVGGQAVDNFDDPIGDLAELGLAKAARGARRGPKADAGGHGRLFRVKRDAVFVAGDVRAAQGLVGDVACDAFGAQIDQHNMGVGAVGDVSRPPLIS